MEVAKQIVAEHTVNLRVSAADIVASLPKQYRDLVAANRAEIFVQVPGGADWSNSELLLDADTPVQIRITYKTAPVTRAGKK